MRKSLPLLLCLIMSIFGVTRAIEAAHVFDPNVEAKAAVNALDSEEDVDPDDVEGVDGTSNDDDGNNIDDNGGNAAGDEDTGDDSGADDGQDDDGGGDQGQ